MGWSRSLKIPIYFFGYELEALDSLRLPLRRQLDRASVVSNNARRQSFFNHLPRQRVLIGVSKRH